jgi:hypothetical protein
MEAEIVPHFENISVFRIVISRNHKLRNIVDGFFVSCGIVQDMHIGSAYKWPAFSLSGIFCFDAGVYCTIIVCAQVNAVIQVTIRPPVQPKIPGSP